jgi:hypothetical protein
MSVMVQRANKVKKQTQPADTTSTWDAVQRYAGGQKVEACSDATGRVLKGVTRNPLIFAVNRAFREHRPLAVSPDIFWLSILQGVSIHVLMNAERLRDRFVKHSEGKVYLEVRRDDFMKGSQKNTWEEVFPVFMELMKPHMTDPTMVERMTGAFSTTGVREQTAFYMGFMDVMKSYCDYGLRTLCGIPEVHIEGTEEDWQQVYLRAESVCMNSGLGLEWWGCHLLPMLEQVVESAAGKDVGEFWQSFYNVDGGSGGPYINGNVLCLFPYRKSYQVPFAPMDFERFLKRQGFMCGVNHDDFPSGVCETPFIWHYFEQKFDMNFLSGFVGVEQDEETLALKPKIGWAISEIGEHAAA